MSDKLKACPSSICGHNEPRLEMNQACYYVKCPLCGARGQRYSFDDDSEETAKSLAIQSWQDRPATLDAGKVKQWIAENAGTHYLPKFELLEAINSGNLGVQ
jgi:hypothetical protein